MSVGPSRGASPSGRTEGSGRAAFIIVTHGDAGAAMLATAQKVVGPLDGVATVSIAQEDPREVVEARIEEAIVRLRDGGVDGGAVFLVDLGGSTPSNICCRACGGRSAVVSGMNLPMLFKLSTLDRTQHPKQLAEELAHTGTKSIQVKS